MLHDYTFSEYLEVSDVKQTQSRLAQIRKLMENRRADYATYVRGYETTQADNFAAGTLLLLDRITFDIGLPGKMWLAGNSVRMYIGPLAMLLRELIVLEPEHAKWVVRYSRTGIDTNYPTEFDIGWVTVKHGSTRHETVNSRRTWIPSGLPTHMDLSQ